jgi:LacI family transcriptional regulator, galactose operon repressor
MLESLQTGFVAVAEAMGTTPPAHEDQVRTHPAHENQAAPTPPAHATSPAPAPENRPAPTPHTKTRPAPTPPVALTRDWIHAGHAGLTRSNGPRKLTPQEDAVADAPVSIREVAALAGVSVGTVSNVLNRPDVVAEPTRSRVQAAIKSLGFIRNESARQLRAGRSRIIGLVVLDVANPFFTDVARGVEDEASESGLAVILCNSDDQQAKESAYLDLLEEHRVQGILITPVSGADDRLARLQRRGTPVVLVDSRSPSGDQCSVSVDDVLGGDLAVSHLVEARHERIAFVGGPMSIRQVADRRDGAVRALERADGSGHDLRIIETPALNVSGGQQAGATLAELPAQTRPTAVFCANDLLALGVLQEMTAHRIRVPDDIALVGYDDIDFAAAAAVPLSSVRQPRHQLGRSAAQLLIEETLGEPTHQHRQVIFEPELVIRQSSRGIPDRPGRSAPAAEALVSEPLVSEAAASETAT